MQMANLTNMALAKLEAAGVVLVPFDSSNLDQAVAVSWAGGTEAIGYELPSALAQYEHLHFTFALPQCTALTVFPTSPAHTVDMHSCTCAHI